jgi:hypothetical protein
MASRQEEKERRRREREEAEAKANASSARTKRLQIIGGVIVGLVVVAVVVVLLVSGGGGDDKGKSMNAATGNASSSASTEVKLPARKIENLEEAAKAAGCTLKTYPIEGSTHVTTTVNYKTNPPTSGDHNPTPAEDGIYDPGNEPAKENYVHSLEHGRIQLQYAKGSPQKTIDTLVAIYNEPVNGSPGYHAQVFENNTNMPAKVAAVAWGQLLTCDDLSDAAIDAIRAFRERYTDKGPEFIP